MSARSYELSIVIPTCNRAELLRRAIETIHESTRVNYQIVIVDGASDDHTPGIIDNARKHLGDRVLCIREPVREGFVRGVNKGFRAAQGNAVCWLNDDARPLPGALDRAYAQLMTSSPSVGLLAMFHAWHSPKNVAYQTSVGSATYSLCHVRGTLYANFGMGLRTTFERLDYFDDNYVFCAADPDFSLKCWHAGLRVEPAWGACVDHDEHADERRLIDNPHLHNDNARLFSKWILPAKNPCKNDFDPAHPCALNGLASNALAA